MRTFYSVKKLNKSRQPFSHLLIFRKFPEIIVGPYNLFFQNHKKAANYGVIGNLWDDKLWGMYCSLILVGNFEPLLKATIAIVAAWLLSAIIWCPAIVLWPIVNGRTIPSDDCYVQPCSSKIANFLKAPIQICNPKSIRSKKKFELL